MKLMKYATPTDQPVTKACLAEGEMGIMRDCYSDHTEIVLSVHATGDLRYAVTLSYPELVDAVRTYNACSNGPPAG
jgi:hypothetical protein